MNDIFANTETMQENEHPRFYTAESVMRGHPDKLCDLIADSVLDACLQHDPASRVACEVMATHGHIIVAGEITTSAKPDVFNIVRDTLRDVGYDPKAYQIDCYIHDQSPDIAGAVEPELAEGEDEDTLGAGDQGVMVGYACNETPEYLPMPVVAAQRLVTLLEISRMTGVIPDIGPDGKVQVTMEYNGDTPVRITTVVISVQHKEDGFKMTPTFEKTQEQVQMTQRPKMKLLGEDGNIFAIMGRASLLLKNAGQSDKAKEMCNRVMSCDSYHKALNVISEYVETELTPKTRNKPNRGDAR